MAQIVINIPDEFLQPLDELVVQDRAGTRENWIHNAVGNLLVQYSVNREFMPQMQRRSMELSVFWR
jgi:metal-responsive CopG/Arc/MetJ family transcriptional regulator